ncbi:MAG: site-specific integrase [Prevotella sp.]|nr:site-specific integrase [Prevotella sp.]
MEKNQKIELRHRTLPSGNQSLYLEFYEKGGKRRYESLKLYLIPEKDENDRRVNENTLKHALKLKSERVLGIEHPQETGEKKLPSKAFADFMDEYQVYLRDIKRASDSYQKMNRSTINIVKSYLTSIRRPRILLSKVDKRFYLNLLAYVRDTYKNTKSPDNPKELSANTKLAFQTTLNTMLNYAVKKGLLLLNPFYEIEVKEKFGKVPSDRTFLTIEEVNSMAKTTTGSPGTKQTFMFCCFTGLRHGDMAALRWKDIRKTDEGEVIFVPSMQKTKHPVIVPLGQKAKSWMPERPKDAGDQLVFPNAPKLGAANRALKNMAKRAGINKLVTFHTSRHTFATMTLTAGADLYTTSKLLGHTSVHTTEIYADVVMEKKADAVNLTNGLFG